MICSRSTPPLVVPAPRADGDDIDRLTIERHLERRRSGGKDILAQRVPGGRERSAHRRHRSSTRQRAHAGGPVGIAIGDHRLDDALTLTDHGLQIGRSSGKIGLLAVGEKAHDRLRHPIDLGNRCLGVPNLVDKRGQLGVKAIAARRQRVQAIEEDAESQHRVGHLAAIVAAQRAVGTPGQKTKAPIVGGVGVEKIVVGVAAVSIAVPHQALGGPKSIQGVHVEVLRQLLLEAVVGGILRHLVHCLQIAATGVASLVGLLLEPAEEFGAKVTGCALVEIAARIVEATGQKRLLDLLDRHVHSEVLAVDRDMGVGAVWSR